MVIQAYLGKQQTTFALDSFAPVSFVRSQSVTEWLSRFYGDECYDHPFTPVGQNRKPLKVLGLARLRVNGPGGEAEIVALVSDTAVPDGVDVLVGTRDFGVLGVNMTCEILEGGGPKENRFTMESSRIHRGIEDKVETITAIEKVVCAIIKDKGGETEEKHNRFLDYIHECKARARSGDLEVQQLPPVELRWDEDAMNRGHYAKPFHLGETRQLFVDQKIDELISERKIEPAIDPALACPALAVKKPGGKGYRFVIAYQQANELIYDNASPLPRIKDILDAVSTSGSKFFSTLDLKDGFWNIYLTERSKEVTTFVTPNGAYWWRVLPQGLKVSAAAFQARISGLLGDLRDVCRVYVDDIIVFARTQEEHDRVVKEVIKRLIQAGLKINEGKCHFGLGEVSMLGHVISGDGIRPNPKRVEALYSMQRPETAAVLASFRAFAAYYRKFIPSFAILEIPLITMEKESVGGVLSWSEKANRAYLEIIAHLAESTLSHEWGVDGIGVRVRTDASKLGIGAVLLVGGKPVAFFSKRLSDTESNYVNSEREMLAVYAAVRHFDEYLYGRHFTLETDHKALLNWVHVRDPSKASTAYTHRVQRWAAGLADYLFDVSHVEGASLVDADYLSRIEERVEELEGWRKRKICVGAINIDQDTPSLSSKVLADPFRGELECFIREREKRWDASQVGNTDEDIADFDDEYRKWYRKEYNVSKTIAKSLDNLRKRLVKRGSCYVFKINGFERIIPPLEEREDIVRRCHDLAHEGYVATADRVRLLYIWPGLLETARKVKFGCEGCCMDSAGQAVSQADACAPVPQRKFDSIVMDCVGPFPMSRNGATYVLTIRDVLSRWVEFIPLEACSAACVLEALYHDWVLRFARPNHIHTDNGSEFIAQWAKLLKREVWGVNVQTTTIPYNPAGNGLAEVSNRSLNAALRRLIGSRQINREDWDIALSRICWAMNTARHRVLGVSPYEMVYGQVPTLLECPWEGKATVRCFDESIESDLDNLIIHAWTNLDRELGKGTPGVELSAGDTAYVTKVKQRMKAAPKLEATADGPYKVVRKTRQGNYIVRDMEGCEKTYKPRRLLKSYVDWENAAKEYKDMEAAEENEDHYEDPAFAAVRARAVGRR